MIMEKRWRFSRAASAGPSMSMRSRQGATVALAGGSGFDFPQQSRVRLGLKMPLRARNDQLRNGKRRPAYSGLTIKITQPHATALPSIINTNGQVAAKFLGKGSINGRKYRLNVMASLLTQRLNCLTRASGYALPGTLLAIFDG